MINAKRLRSSMFQAGLAAALALAGANAFSQVTGPDVVPGGKYAVVYQRKGTTTYLQERVGNGAWFIIATSQGCCAGVPLDFNNKPAAEYYYRTYVGTTSGRTTTWWTSPEKKIVVVNLPSNRDTIAHQMQYGYSARIGDINADGLQDLFISRTSGGTAGNGSLENVILRRLADGSFASDVPSAGQIANASGWPVSSVELRKSDMNLDGFVDLSIRDLGNHISGAQGQVVLAPGGAGPAVQRAIPMNAKFNKFLADTKGWMRNPNYFVDNSQTYLIPVYGWVYRCDYIWMNDSYQYYCGGFYDIVGYTIYYDTSWADQDAIFLRYAFANYSNGILQPTIEPGSPYGLNVDLIFTSVFGAQAFRGNYRSYCIDWDYDTDYHPLCIDWALALLQALRELMPEDDGFRYLTAGEKAEAVRNGLQIVDVDQVRVYYGARWNMPWMQSQIESYRGHIYVGNEPWAAIPWSSDYSIEVGPNWLNLATMVHEMTHVYQYRTLGCGYFCKMRVGPRLMPSYSDYIYIPWDSVKPYRDYNLEAQAEMVSDRFLLPKTGQPMKNENRTADLLQKLNSKIPFATTN